MSKQVFELNFFTYSYSIINLAMQTILYRDPVCMVHPQDALTIL